MNWNFDPRAGVAWDIADNGQWMVNGGFGVYFETANRLQPALPFASVAEGIAESQEHNSAEALATFRAAAKRHPHDALNPVPVG